MKTERRHELQTNALADALGHTVDSVKPYSQIIMGGVLAVVVIVAVVKFLSVRSQSEQVDAWNIYLRATASSSKESAEDLSRLIQQYPNTPAAQWAHLFLADQDLEEGIGQLFQDRAEGRAKLRKAEEHYQAVQQKASEPLLAQRATLGLGRAYESQVELEKAKKEYNQLRERWPDSAFTLAAKERLDDLDLQSTKEFYDWFAENEPKGSSSFGDPGSRPSFNLGDPKDDFKLESLNTPTTEEVNKTSSTPGDSSTPKEPVSTASREPKPESTPPNESPNP